MGDRARVNNSNPRGHEGGLGTCWITAEFHQTHMCRRIADLPGMLLSGRVSLSVIHLESSKKLTSGDASTDRSRSVTSERSLKAAGTTTLQEGLVVQREASETSSALCMSGGLPWNTRSGPRLTACGLPARPKRHV